MELNIKRFSVIIKLIISVALVGYLFSFVDWSHVARLNYKSLIVLVLGILFTLLLLFFMSLRWVLLLSVKTNNRIEKSTAYRGYVTSLFLTNFIPAIGGDLFRIKYSSDKTGIAIAKAGLIVFIERIFGLTALGLIFFTGLFVVGIDAVKTLIPSNNILLIFGTSSCITLSVMLYLLKNKYGLPFADMFKVLLLSIAAQGIDVAIAGFALSVIAPKADPLWIMIAVPLAYIATLLPISIGGLGVREGVMAGVLSFFGVAVSSAVLLSFMIYLIKLLTGLIGGIYVFWVKPESGLKYQRISEELKKNFLR